MMNFKRINAFDIFIILILVSVLVGGLAVYCLPNILTSSPASLSEKTQTEQNISFSVRIENVSKELTETIIINDPIYETWSEINIGTIQSINIVPYSDYVPNLVTGEYCMRSIPDKYTVILEIEHSGPLEYKILQGQSINISGKNYKCTGHIWRITDEEDKHD